MISKTKQMAAGLVIYALEHPGAVCHAGCGNHHACTGIYDYVGSLLLLMGAAYTYEDIDVGHIRKIMMSNGSIIYCCYKENKDVSKI